MQITPFTGSGLIRAGQCRFLGGDFACSGAGRADVWNGMPTTGAQVATFRTSPWVHRDDTELQQPGHLCQDGIYVVVDTGTDVEGFIWWE